MVTGTPELAGAVVMRKDPLASCWQQGINGGGQLHIKVAEAAQIMGGQLDRDAVVDVAPIRMVAAGFRQQGHLAHEAKGFNEVAEHELACHPVSRQGPERPLLCELLALIA